jgi:diguanylate cyclase (GGDEF)-like protein
MGLLCKIGTLALASVYPDQYGNLLQESHQADSSQLAQREREEFGIDHCEVGAFMIEDWGLPRANAEALLAFESDHTDAIALDQGAVQLALTLRDAEIVAEVLLANKDCGPKDLQTLLRNLNDLGQRMGMGAVELNAFHERLTREFQDWLRLLKLPLREVAGLAELQSASMAIPISERESGERDLNAAQALHRAATVVQRAGMPRGLRILVVDDDAVSLRILEQALAQEGHQVITARDGREALALALEHNPQAVIADWMMPRMDGVELCRTLRSIEQGREMYFLLLTSCDDEQRTVQAFEAGVDDYITKPISPRLLMARLKGSQRLIEIKAARERDRINMSEQVKELAIAKRRLKATANTDVLTSLPNRRAILEALEAEWSVSVGSGAPLSLIMIDVDHFKQVNDRHGHDVGDEVLREIARVLRANIRQGEDVARLGGEEFLVVCPNTRHDQAVIGAERMRQAIERQLIHAGSFTGSVTASFGVAERLAAMQDIFELLKRADEAVYQAKAAGRNIVCEDRGAGRADKRA